MDTQSTPSLSGTIHIPIAVDGVEKTFSIQIIPPAKNISIEKLENNLVKNRDMLNKSFSDFYTIYIEKYSNKINTNSLGISEIINNALTARFNINILIPLININGGQSEFTKLESLPVKFHIERLIKKSKNYALKKSIDDELHDELHDELKEKYSTEVGYIFKPVSIFISYASEDEKEAIKIRRFLISNSFEVWMDKFELLPGEKWNNKIINVIEGSDFILFCLSNSFLNKRGYVQTELKKAVELDDYKLDDDIFLIPVKIEECEVPKKLSKYHYVNFFDNNGKKMLLRSLKEGSKKRGLNDRG